MPKPAPGSEDVPGSGAATDVNTTTTHFVGNRPTAGASTLETGGRVFGTENAEQRVDDTSRGKGA